MFKSSIFQKHSNECTIPRKVLFILKQREVLYENEQQADGQYSCGILHSGLFNSASFINNMLNDNGFESVVVHAIDNNCIDRLVTKHRPDVVIIEAFWVVPEKFDILAKLHPSVKWVIRNHSKTPFLANEGIAYDWALKYTENPNVYISSNSHVTNEEMIRLVRSKYGMSYEQAKNRCPYLPNYYPIHFDDHLHEHRIIQKDVINISCFGAIRPLKNHMIQAVAAIKFAEQHNLKLRFHINGNRVEGNAGSILRNLRSLFSHLPNHELVEHAWVPHDQFLKIVAQMDVGLQVSYTETYNIVAADHVQMGVPIITSDEIDWVDSKFYANPNSSDDIVKVLTMIFRCRQFRSTKSLLRKTLRNAEQFNRKTIRCWKEVLYKL